MRLEALKHLAATLAFHAAREGVAAPAQHTGQLESGWFKHLAQHEAELRSKAQGVDDHVRALIARAQQLPEAPPGLAVVAELKKTSFACIDCTAPDEVCGADPARNARNLTAARRDCMRYLTAHFAELCRIAEAVVQQYARGMTLAAPDVRLEVRIATPEEKPIDVQHRRESAHTITLAIDPARLTGPLFHALTFELFQVVLGRAWDGAAQGDAERAPDDDPFVDGWMTEIAYRALDLWLRRQRNDIPAREKRVRQAGLQVNGRTLDTEFGPPAPNARLGIEVARQFGDVWQGWMSETRASELLVRWSIWLLVVRPARREKLVEIPLTRKQMTDVAASFLPVPALQSAVIAWDHLVSTFS
jgi:hypothetical protein